MLVQRLCVALVNLEAASVVDRFALAPWRTSQNSAVRAIMGYPYTPQEVNWQNTQPKPLVIDL